MRVVIAGGGIAGLTGALVLARDGHEVVLLERDATPMPASPADAFEHWERRGAPQVRHSHAFLARLRNTLLLHAPDVLARLLAAGATEIRFADNLPESLTDRAPRVGDDELVALACRRTTFEWVLRRCVLDSPGVTLRDGIDVLGLTRATTETRIDGLRVRDGDTESAVAADLVVDATGARGPTERWLDAVGAPVASESHDSGIVYSSRFYRLRDGAEVPVAGGPVAGDLGYLKFAVFVGDNRTFSVTLAVPTDDAVLRRSLARPGAFEEAARAIDPAREWLDGRAQPITDVHLMAGLRNRKRRFVVGDRPIVDGFAALGDASVCTNPLYGRGCSLAVVHAFGLAETLRDHPDGRDALCAFDAFTTAELDPWFRAAVLQDSEGQTAAEGDEAPLGLPPAFADADGEDPRAFLRSVLRDGLVPALETSPVVFRAFLRWFNLLASPDALIADGEVITEVMAAYATRDQRPPRAPFGPDRDALLARIGAE